MNFRENQQCNEIINRLLECVDEEQIRRRIDDPIDKIIAQFPFPKSKSISYGEFLSSLKKFLYEIYAHALPCSRQFSPDEACAEGIHLLETGYSNLGSQGFNAAVLDATDPEQSGFETIAIRLGELIKAREREKYIRWGFAVVLDNCDWSMKCQIAKILFERLQEDFPIALQKKPPEQFADSIPLLIRFHAQTETLLEQLSNKNFL